MRAVLSIVSSAIPKVNATSLPRMGHYYIVKRCIALAEARKANFNHHWRDTSAVLSSNLQRDKVTAWRNRRIHGAERSGKAGQPRRALALNILPASVGLVAAPIGGLHNHDYDGRCL